MSDLNCECSDGVLGGCCQGLGPAVMEVDRNGKKLKLCTRCDFPSDKRLCLLVDEVTPEQEAFDILGAVCLAGWLSEEKTGATT